jgi:hypothetical protein
MVVLSAMAAAAAVLALLERGSRPLEWARRIALGALVADGAIGLALAVRGGRPDEWIHWLYGVVVVVVLLIPGTVAPEMPARVRSGALALSSAIAAAVAWRLWASG